MTPNQVRARLLDRCDQTFKGFAIEHGYEVRTVSLAVARYAGSAKKPRGILTFKILRDLSKAINEPIIDGLNELVE